MSADTIVNAAELAWKIIEGGKASAQISTAHANAVPQVDDWMSLTETRGPKTIKMHYANHFLWPLDDYVHVEFDIALKFQYGARYQGGGAFIPNVWVEVPECFVGWPWNANIDLRCQPPTNVGQTGAPHACMAVSVSGTVSSGAELNRVEWGFNLYGSGAWEQTS